MPVCSLRASMSHIRESVMLNVMSSVYLPQPLGVITVIYTGAYHDSLGHVGLSVHKKTT
jgi:hypothetical protein